MRASYELRPYPAVSKVALRRPRWLLPPAEWIYAVAQPADFPPRRVLVAGCGTGMEAFAFRRRFPQAEIVAVDFAAESIRIARRTQKHLARSAPLRFVRADLTSVAFARAVGQNFDFISCHGVMSYVPAPARAIRNLARCLAPEGILYLGVNGAAHFSESWRKFLPAFGFEMERWPGGGKLWRHLELCAALMGDTEGRILRHGEVYLAGDLFGPVIRNLRLRLWAQICRRAGLHFRGSYSAQRLFWPALNDGSYKLFLPRSRAQTAEQLDELWPTSFHQLIFTRQRELLPPWRESAQLLKWRPVSVKQGPGVKWRTRRGTPLLTIENSAANTSIELRVAAWELELLRSSNGTVALRELLRNVVPAVPPAKLRFRLYLFYQLNLLNFRPPPLSDRAGAG